MIATDPQTAIEVEKLAILLSELATEETVTYETLSEAVGYSIQHRPFTLIKARKIVEEQSGLRFSTVMRIGVKKLPATAVPGIGVVARKRIGRAAKRQAKRLTGLKYNDIDSRVQARIDAERSLLAAISTVSTADVGEFEKETSTTGPMVARQVFDALRKRESA